MKKKFLFSFQMTKFDLINLIRVIEILQTVSIILFDWLIVVKTSFLPNLFENLLTNNSPPPV